MISWPRRVLTELLTLTSTLTHNPHLRREPLIGCVCGWALLAISAKLNASDGNFQQGSSATTVIVFDADKLSEYAAAAKESFKTCYSFVES